MAGGELERRATRKAREPPPMREPGIIAVVWRSAPGPPFIAVPLRPATRAGAAEGLEPLPPKPIAPPSAPGCAVPVVGFRPVGYE